jgi:P27 family predicted phage terminase small subunit
LAPQAKKLWKALAPQLEKLGLLTKIDGAAFEAVCQEYAIWVQCELYLKKAGRTTVMNRKSEWDEDREGNIVEHVTDSGYEQQRPEVAIGNKALAALKAFCTEFGLTPSSRSRINLPAPDEETDPMEALLKRSGG